jgi:hypothetical protein
MSPFNRLLLRGERLARLCEGARERRLLGKRQTLHEQETGRVPSLLAGAERLAAELWAGMARCR